MYLLLYFFFLISIKTVLKYDWATVKKAEKFGILFIAYVQLIFQRIAASSVKRVGSSLITNTNDEVLDNG